MPNLSIKNVPEELLSQLRARAQDNHRSLQGELMSILEAAVMPTTLTLEDAHRKIKKLGVKTGEESASMIRQDRDAR